MFINLPDFISRSSNKMNLAIIYSVTAVGLGRLRRNSGNQYFSFKCARVDLPENLYSHGFASGVLSHQETRFYQNTKLIYFFSLSF